MGTPYNQTSNNRSDLKSFEGRILPNQDKDPEDQGLAFDLTTMENRISRRRLLGMFGIDAGSVAHAACTPNATSGSSTAGSSQASTAAPASSSTPSTEVASDTLMEMNTEGPYPADGSNGPDALEQVGVERSDIGSTIGGATASGVPLKLRMNIIDMVNGNAPMSGAAV